VARGLGDLDLLEHVALATDRVSGDTDESADFGLDDHSMGPVDILATPIVTKQGGRALP
jgi:hypothetical protein